MNSTPNLAESIAIPADSIVTQSRCKPVQIKVVKAEELCGSLLEEWDRLRSGTSVYQSPYFDAEFVKAASRVRDDVRIAIALEEDEIVSFLPIQQNSRGRAVPAGGLLNDWHGILGKSSVGILKAMLKEIGVRSYKYHAMDNAESDFSKFHFEEYQSHFLDLSAGWEAYKKWAFKNSSTIKRQGQKSRGLQRDFGDVRFEFEADSPELLERLIELKRSKYQRSNTFDILGVPWAAELLREIHKIRKPNFRGLLSTYWAGDELVGAHFGMLTDRVLHYWFPVYDPRFQRYSPGTEMLMQAAEHACKIGVKKLDLGYGDDAYKFKFCNAHEPVAFGMVNFNQVSHQMARQQYLLRNQLKDIPMKPMVKRALRSVFPRFGGWNFR
jgi:CelD/BcsL family acetyltransferase involved in cellulose biosynthesis